MVYKKWIAAALSVVLLLPVMLLPVSAKTVVKPEQEGLLGALGFLSTLRASDGSYDYDREITRAEFTAEVMHFRQFDLVYPQMNYFNDVSGHLYEAEINKAAECGVVLGFGAGAFHPDQIITLDEAVRVLARALGFQQIELSNAAELQKAYRDILNDLSLLDSLNMSGSQLVGGDMAVLLYNMLNAPVAGITGSGSYFTYSVSSDETILSKFYDIYEETGILNATDKTSLTSADAMSRGYIRVGSRSYAAEGDYTDYLGSQVKFYYQEQDGERTVIYLWELEGKMEILRLDASEIEGYSANTLRYTTNDGERTETARLPLQPNVIYNGKYIADFTAEDITPTYGSLKLIDQNGDGLYETVLVTSVEYYVVEMVRTADNVIVGKYGKPELDMNEDSNSIKEIWYNGRSAELSYIQPDDVLAVSASKDQSFVSVTMLTTRVEGTVAALSDDDMQIGTETYPYEAEIINKPSVGDSGKFYLDESGRVVACILEDVTSKYRYAWALKAGLESEKGKESMKLKCLTEDGAVSTLTTAEKVKYEDLQTGVSIRLAADKLYETYFRESGGSSFGMIMYETDADGLVKTILRYRDNTQKSDDEKKDDPGYDTTADFSRDVIMTGMRIYNNQFASFTYLYDATTKVFLIPPDEASASEDDYVAGDSSLVNGDLRNLTIEGYNANEGKKLGAMAVFMDKKAGEASSAMYVNNTLIISKVGEAVDENGDTVLSVSGYEGGALKTLVFPKPELTSYTSNLPGSVSRADSLGFGDVISYSLNNNTKKVDTFLVIFQWSKRKDMEKGQYYEAGNDNPSVTPENAIANCHTIFGKVKGNRENSIIINGNGDTTDNTWDRVFSHNTSTTAYLVDVDRQKITIADQADAAEGDVAFIRNRLGVMNLLVIYR